MSSKDKKPVFVILSILFFFNILAWIAVFNLSQPRFLEVVFFDVGQGDAIFIETPQRHQILIDGGPDTAILEKLGEQMPFWDRSIDLIILTHPSADHLSGLLFVLERYDVESILWTGVKSDTLAYQRWIDLVEKEKANIFIAQKGQRIRLGEKVYLDILYPFEILEGEMVRREAKMNNTSIVSRLVYGDNSFLFTGDIEKRGEQDLSKKNEIYLNSDILKIAHHGSKTSTSEEFLKKVNPKIAVIQVGENRFGHPHLEVLERLEKFDVKILRNDQQGNIKIISDKYHFKIKKNR